jgi:hypothetical protein
MTLFNDFRTTPLPVVMGPCVRRDDAVGFEFQTATAVIASASEAIQLSLQKLRKLDCFVALFLAMTLIQFRILAARCAGVLLLISAPKGRGECRAPNAPAASRVKLNKHTS